MYFIKPVTNVYVLLLVVRFGQTQFFDFFYNSIPCPPLTSGSEDNATVTLPNIAVPFAPLPPLIPSVVSTENATVPELVDNCTTLNLNGNSTTGNSLFIIVDSKSLQAILEVVEPCNTTATYPAASANPSLPTGNTTGVSNPPTLLPPASGGASASGGAPLSGLASTPRVPSSVTILIPLDSANGFSRAKRQSQSTGEIQPVVISTPDADPSVETPLPVPVNSPNIGENPPISNNDINETVDPSPSTAVPAAPSSENSTTEALPPGPSAPSVELPSTLSIVSPPEIPPSPVGVPPPISPSTPGPVPPTTEVSTPGTTPSPAPSPPSETIPSPGLPTIPGTVPPAGNSSVLVPPNGAVPPIPGASSGLLCNLLTLIQTLVASILQFVSNLLKQLVSIVISLLRNIFRTVLGQLLPQLLLTVEQLLTNLLKGVNQSINSTLTDLQSRDALLSGLSSTPMNALSALNPQQAQQFNQTVIDPLTGLIAEVEGLLKDLLIDPNSTAGVVGNIALTLNNTLDILLEDVERTVNKSLTDLLGGNSSLIVKLTDDLTTLLKNVLGDTVCNVQKLLTDSGSLSGLIQNLLKLIQNLLNDVLRDITTLLINTLNNLLSDKGLLDNLLRNILKLITDLLKNLLTPKLSKLKNLPLIADPRFKAALIANLTNNVRGLTPVPSIPLMGDAGLGLENVIERVLDPIVQLLNNLIKVVEGLIKNLDNLLANSESGLINGLLNSVRSLLNNLLSSLGQQVSTLLGSQLNISNILNPSALLGPLSTPVTGILKQVVCDSCNSTLPPVTIVPPVTTAPITPSPGQPTPNGTVPCVPIYYPVEPPFQCIEDTLFDNVNDADGFVSGLNQYQDYINRNVYGAIGENWGGDLVDSLLDDDDPRDYNDNDAFPLNFESLTNRLINGLTGTEKFTRNVASKGLWNLINSLTRTASNSTSASTASPLPAMALPPAAAPQLQS